MMKKNIDIYRFSGTGNTLLVAEKLAEVFRRNGKTVRFFRIEKSDPAGIDTDHTLGLAFPVAAQSTYPLVWDFIEKLPPGVGTGVFMVDTLHSFSGGIVGPLRKIMAGKGYRPLGAREIPMPNNFLPGKINPAKNRAKVESGLENAVLFAEALLAGRARWGRVPLFSDLMNLLSRSRPVVNYLRRRGTKFTVEERSCTRCGTCVKLCPAANIAMEAGEYPVFSERCQQCMRCISLCPTGAIVVPGKKYKVYRAVTAAEILNHS